MWGRFSFLARVSALALFFGHASAQDSLNVTQIGQLYYWDGAEDVVVTGDFAYVAAGPSGLRIVDVTNPAGPLEVGFYDTPGSATGLAVSGNYAYVADEGARLPVVDITNPSVPFEAGFYYSPGGALGVVVSGNYAYVAAGYWGLRVVNIANPAAPTEVGFYDTPGNAQDVAVAGNYAYVADGWGGLRVVDITNPAAPFEVGFYDTPGFAWGVAVSGNYAYVADWDGGLRVVNIMNPAAPAETGFYDTPGLARGVAVSGNYAYVADMSYFGIYDCSAATGISSQTVVQPLTWKLNANYPNPFNPITTISFDVPRAERVTVNVYNIAGQFVQTLVDERLTPGAHMIRFDGSSLSSGTYFYRLASPEFSATRKMVLVK